MNVPNPAAVALVAAILASVVWDRAAAQESRLAEVSGCVVHPWGKGGLRVLSLPHRKETLVGRLADDDAEFYPTVHAISGPDDKGRIAYVEDHFFVADETDRKHVLKIVNIDGTQDTALFSRGGSAMWAVSNQGRGEIGRHIALAPTGGMVALLSGLTARQMPRALLREGDIEIWCIENKRRSTVTTKAINQPMSWFPDGKRLAYTKLVPRGDLPPSAIGLDRFGTYFGQTWDRVPAIYVLDIKTGAASFLHVGWTAVVASDGKAVLVGGWDERSDPPFSWSRYDIETRSSAAVKWPDDAGGAIAAPTSNIVLYLGLDAAGVEMDPQRPFSIKLATIDITESATVVTGIGQYTPVSFGRTGHEKQ